jgi:hypothetical protein
VLTMKICPEEVTNLKYAFEIVDAVHVIVKGDDFKPLNNMLYVIDFKNNFTSKQTQIDITFLKTTQLYEKLPKSIKVRKLAVDGVLDEYLPPLLKSFKFDHLSIKGVVTIN